MTPKDTAAQNRKEQILEAAAALFAEFGYYKTTTAEVARKVGVTQPYVFHFFKSKEELYLAVLKQATDRIVHAFTITEAPPEQLPEAMGEAFFELLSNYRNEILLAMMAHATPEPAVREFTRSVFDQVYDRVKQRFENAGIPDAGRKTSIFIGHGLMCALAESIQLPKLLHWEQ
ncbi:AcrR family transcriptional regulator [Paenibacillus phyllosphaerae]|uniref:AcrR family transcriptional regulator n=1 Tax=Paenibacillus phyllosphaerae TaxID=274593 RepID=A0A7W5B2M5_9BACL|nr:TetR/AcrR family transcriptional regulator [Paenibacillus phyllosphaerae]MBB3113283.1 AcrR family transcriptional regulator [Paenibacillus phyllosphaerae]